MRIVAQQPQQKVIVELFAMGLLSSNAAIARLTSDGKMTTEQAIALLSPPNNSEEK